MFWTVVGPLVGGVLAYFLSIARLRREFGHQRAMDHASQVRTACVGMAGELEALRLAAARMEAIVMFSPWDQPELFREPLTSAYETLDAARTSLTQLALLVDDSEPAIAVCEELIADGEFIFKQADLLRQLGQQTGPGAWQYPGAEVSQRVAKMKDAPRRFSAAARKLVRDTLDAASMTSPAVASATQPTS